MLNGNESCLQRFSLLTLPDSLLSNYKALFRIAEVNRPAAARALFVWFGVARNIEAGSLGILQGKEVGGLWALGRVGGEERGSIQGLQQQGAGRRGGVGSVQVQCQKFRFGAAFESRVR